MTAAGFVLTDTSTDRNGEVRLLTYDAAGKLLAMKVHAPTSPVGGAAPGAAAVDHLMRLVIVGRRTKGATVRPFVARFWL